MGQDFAPAPLLIWQCRGSSGVQVAQTVEQVQPVHNTLDGFSVYVGWIKIGLAPLVLDNAVLAIYARWDDRRRAVR